MVPYEQMLSDVLDNPDDDWPRLMFCDWLEENHQDERAQFIRIQLAKAKLPVPLPPQEDVETQCYACGGPLFNDHTRCEYHQLQFEEYCLLYAPSRHGNKQWDELRCQIEKRTAADEIEMRRGFLHRIRCTWTEWSKYGYHILKTEPLAILELSQWPRKMVFHRCKWDCEPFMTELVAADGRGSIFKESFPDRNTMIGGHMRILKAFAAREGIQGPYYPSARESFVLSTETRSNSWY